MNMGGTKLSVAGRSEGLQVTERGEGKLLFDPEHGSVSHQRELRLWECLGGSSESCYLFTWVTSIT